MVVLLAMAVCLPDARGRQTSVSAGLALRQEYDSNYNRTRENPEEVWISTVSPSIRVLSLSRNDSLSFLYEPGYVVNLTTDSRDISQRLLFDVAGNLSEKFKISAGDAFSRSRDYQLAQEAGVDLTDKRGPRKYWVNTAKLDGTYVYQQNSMLTLGYSNSMLTDEDTEVNNYQKHASSITIIQQLSQRWQALFSYVYTRGDFEQSVDLVSHVPSLRLTFTPEPSATIFSTYSYAKTDYDGLNIGNVTQNGALGFSYRFDPNTSLSCSVGKYYVFEEMGADNDGYSYDLNLARRYEKGEISFSGRGGMEDRQFSGSAEGLTRYWTTQTSGTYRFAEAWSSGVSAYFRNNKFIDQILATREESYGGSLDVACSFWRWYKFALRYTYSGLKADLDIKDYQDHRFMLELSGTAEQWRW